MFKRFGVATLIMGSVLALVPASGFARDRDDFYRGDNAYGCSRNEYVNRDNHEYREHGRRDLRERSYNQRWERGRYNDRYDNSYGSYSNTYDRNGAYGNSHDRSGAYGSYDRGGNWNGSRY